MARIRRMNETKSAEAVAAQQLFNERMKQHTEEAYKIRWCIVELYILNPEKKGFTSEEIMAWLATKGYKLSKLSFAAKMNQIGEQFVKEEKAGTTTYSRRICKVCEKPIELNESSTYISEFRIGGHEPEGHEKCLQKLLSMHEAHEEFRQEYEQMLRTRTEEGDELALRLKEAQERIAWLTPAPSPAPNQRRIEL